MNSPIVIWRNQKNVRNLLGQKGTIISWTKIQVAPPEFEYQAPYFIALIKLESGEIRSGQLVDVEDKKVKIGLKVRAVLRRLGKVSSEEVLDYGIKFNVSE